MKRTVVLLATLLLSFGLIYAGNIVEYRNAGQLSTTIGDEVTDTVWNGVTTFMEMWVENDDHLGSFTFSTRISSPNPEVSWTMNNIGSTTSGFPPVTVYHPFTSSPGGRMDPILNHFDFLGGYQVFVGPGAVDLKVGGLKSSGMGLLPGALGPSIRLNYTPAHTGTELDLYTICFQQLNLPSGGDFIFGTAGGTVVIPDNFPSTYCFPFKTRGIIPPVFTDCQSSAKIVNHCDNGTEGVVAIDGGNDPALPITFSISGHDGDGSAVLSGVTATTANVVYTPAPSDAGSTVSVTVLATNDGGPSDPCIVQFTITNTAPTITIDDDLIKVSKGNPVNYPGISGDDDDDCDNAVISIISMVPAGTNAPVWNGTNFYWLTTEADVGTHTVTMQVTDGIATVTDVFDIEVLNEAAFVVAIEKDYNPEDGQPDGVLQGHYTTVDVDLLSGDRRIGGFDLLIGYDASALTFIEAEKGDLLTTCGWEYFTYRYSWNGNCGNGCPSGLLRVVGIADINDGPTHPSAACFDLEEPTPTTGGLAELTFLVTNDRTFECMYIPVYFYWMDCGDNSLSSPAGDTLYMATTNHNYYGIGGNVALPTSADKLYNKIFDYADGLAMTFPTPFGPDADCYTGVQIKQSYPLPFVEFFNGGVDIICAEDIDDRGDINMNGIPNEIADAVMFTNYFINGLSAFAGHVDASIAASDVNADGTVLSVADLVYLIRVIVGDALPYPKPVAGAEMTLAYTNGTVSYNASHRAGAALLVFEVQGNIGTPEAIDGASGMDVEYSYNEGELRVLVYNIGSNGIAAGDHNLMTLPIDGQATLIDAEVATYEGTSMDVSINNIPTNFELAQNYPNPFNPKTTIALSLPVESDWTVKIYNVAGQLVNSYNGHSAAGTVNVDWDATDRNGQTVASGIYFYKATADSFSATKKMVLMK